ncbi:hypothetical protein BDZ90DRAFT_134968 [Jaminaea rosea]|uniref:GIT Spa2 homology (SHD) domain-containing protein n=1 Tax=Jaminaea rosea TaxID=1569628 RepID=A0A316UUG3_9BASI|nr:hypothetical protein BDZ90DRAFT_134968 [Jaminaea rosea]PWN28947.1 hypothetical protein BDZ90DRAFT_134968 [Jaminaea rosea]
MSHAVMPPPAIARAVPDFSLNTSSGPRSPTSPYPMSALGSGIPSSGGVSGSFQQQQQQQQQQQGEQRYASSSSSTLPSSPPASSSMSYQQQQQPQRQPSYQSSASQQQPQPGLLASPSPTQQATRMRRQRPDTEEIRRVGRVHYQELLNFLRSHLAKDQTGPRSNAREKLTRLSKQQFTELSTDVYDELMRRLTNAREQSTSSNPHLAVRDEFHPKRNQARQKLATLPKTRFKDLSSDVFFELERRFPELKEEFRPDAIAREREAAAAQKQREEQEAAGNRGVATSDVIVPKKSTLVDEDVSVNFQGGERSSELPTHGSPPNGAEESTADDHNDNRSTMYSQASSVGTGFFNGYAASRGPGTESVSSPMLGGGGGSFDGSAPFGVEKLRSDYEFKIATLNQRITALETHNLELKEHASKSDQHEEALRGVEAERDRLRSEHAQQLRDVHEESQRLRSQHDEKHRELQDAHGRLESTQEELQRAMASNSGAGAEEVERMQEELAQQSQIVQELREEVESLVNEVQQLSGRIEELVAEKDQDLAMVRDLNAQVQTFKRKYEQARTELRQYKATSQHLVAQPKVEEEFLRPTAGGAIADVNVTAFQTSIDELLAAARSTTPSTVLSSMKAVVLATTLVTDDVAKYEQMPTSAANGDVESIGQLKPKISTTLNNLMTACRNHASAKGMSPVSLLDAAASHVSMTVVEMVKLAKVRPATAAEKEQYEAHFSGNTLPPGGLKPLHISTTNGPASARSVPMTPTEPRSADSVFKSGGGGNGPSSAGGLRSFSGPLSDRLNGANDNMSDRLSPRTLKGNAGPGGVGAGGRYSPVGYRSTSGVVPVRVPSNGSWQNGHRSRAASIASNSSNNGPASGPPMTPGGGSTSGDQIPALPRTDLSNIRSQWGGGASSSSSPPRRPVSNASSAVNGASSARQLSGNHSQQSSTSFFAGSGAAGANGPRLSGVSPARGLPNSGMSPAARNSLIGANGGEDTGSHEENWAELRNYIEVQTEAIVHSIQALLSAIREGAQANQLNENLVQITTIASSIVAISRENLGETGGQGEGEEILAELQENCDRLAEMQTKEVFDKGTKSAMASASYGVAKGLKALNGHLNAVDVSSAAAAGGAGKQMPSSPLAQAVKNGGREEYSDDGSEYDLS